MVCAKCKTELPDEAVYCFMCGIKQGKRNKRSHGDGSYYQLKNGTWSYRVSKDVDTRKSFYGKTKKEARQAYENYLSGINKDKIEIKTVRAWAERWLEIYKKDKVGYGTYKNYKGYVENHIIPDLGHFHLDKVRPAHIAEFFSRKTSLSASAQKHINVALNGIFKTAVKNKYCNENPVEPLAVEEHDEPAVKVFTKAQLDKIIKDAKTHRYGIYVLLPLYTGLRQAECRALKWGDIDFGAELISITRTIAIAENGSTTKIPKGKRSRTIGLKSELAAELNKLPRDGEYIFSNKEGKYISANTYSRRYRAFFDDTGNQYLTSHKCRHTHGTFLLRGGADLRSVQDALGHASPIVTEIYTHIDEDDIKKSIAKLKF